MLQIVIWLGCFYILLKGLEMLQAGRSAPEGSATYNIGYVGFGLAVVGAIFFIWLAGEQASSSPSMTDLGASSLPFSYPTDPTMIDPMMMDVTNDVTALDAAPYPSDTGN